MKKVLLCAVLAVAILAVSGMTFGADKAGKIAGFLSDVACGSAGNSHDGANMKTEPEKHTVSCMLACKASGYGMLINEGSASEKNYVFYKFDKKGSDLAAGLLGKTKKKDGFAIEVMGVKEKDMIQVTSIKVAAGK